MYNGNIVNGDIIKSNIVERLQNSMQSTPPVNSYPHNWDLRLIGMYLRPQFPNNQSNIHLIRIAHYSYYFSLAI